MSLSVTVLGCSGTFASAGGACSGYLVRSDHTTLWLDCGPGTLGNVQRHVDLPEIDAIVVSHSHPDHWLELPVLRNALKYSFGIEGLRVLGTAETKHQLDVVCSDGVAPTFAWETMSDGAQTNDRRSRRAVLADRPSRGDARCANRGRRTHARLHGRHRAGVVAVCARPRRSRIRPRAVRGDAQPRRRRGGATLLRPPGRIDGHRQRRAASGPDPPDGRNCRCTPAGGRGGLQRSGHNRDDPREV